MNLHVQRLHLGEGANIFGFASSSFLLHLWLLDHQVEATVAEDKAEPKWEGEGAELPCPRRPCCTGSREGMLSSPAHRAPSVFLHGRVL